MKEYSQYTQAYNIVENKLTKTDENYLQKLHEG